MAVTDKKVQAQEELKLDRPKVKQVIRYVSRDNSGLEGSWRNDWIEDYLSTYVLSGYKLHTVLQFDSNQWGVGYTYILVLDE